MSTATEKGQSTEDTEEQVQERIRARLEELKKELETGQAELQQVEMRRTYLRETMLRIEGAMQALGQLLAEGEPAEQNNGTAPVGEQGATARAKGGSA